MSSSCFQISEMPKPLFLNQTLEELNIGTFQKIAVVRADTPLYTALGIFVEQRVSALPVVDDKGIWTCSNAVLLIFSKYNFVVFVFLLMVCLFFCRSSG